MPFSFKFDETTTSKVCKQFDSYVQNWSKRENKVVNSNRGPLFMGHCTREQIVEHYEEF